MWVFGEGVLKTEGPARGKALEEAARRHASCHGESSPGVQVEVEN